MVTGDSYLERLFFNWRMGSILPVNFVCNFNTGVPYDFYFFRQGQGHERTYKKGGRLKKIESEVPILKKMLSDEKSLFIKKIHTVYPQTGEYILGQNIML